MNAKENSARCRHKKDNKQYAQYKIQKVGISMSLSKSMKYNVCCVML